MSFSSLAPKDYLGASDEKDIARKAKKFNGPWEQVTKRT
jgi:hypothetical protein